MDIRFAALDQSAVVRRRMAMPRTHDRASAYDTRDYFDDDIPDLLGPSGEADAGNLRTPASTASSQPGSSLGLFLELTDARGSARLPKTLNDLVAAQLPEGLVVALGELVRAGHDEKVVVRAVLEALGALLADGSIKARASRQFVRALRHQFARDDGARELRRAVRAAVEAEVRAVAA